MRYFKQKYLLANLNMRKCYITNLPTSFLNNLKYYLFLNLANFNTIKFYLNIYLIF